jgi:hypothetical protein
MIQIKIILQNVEILNNCYLFDLSLITTSEEKKVCMIYLQYIYLFFLCLLHIIEIFIIIKILKIILYYTVFNHTPIIS